MIHVAELTADALELGHAALNALVPLVGEGQCIALLIDPMLRDPGVEDWAVGLGRRRLRVANAAAEQSPYVVWVDIDTHEGERALQASLMAGAAESLGLMDTDEHQVRSLAAWLVPSTRLDVGQRRQLVSMLSELSIWPNQRDITFRFWDPRVASVLGDALGGNAWRDVLAGLSLSQWCCFGSSKVFTCTERSFASSSEPRWAVTPDISRRLQALSWRNRVWHLARAWATLDELELSGVSRLVERAMRYGLSHEDDVIRYAHCALTIHPEFDRHPVVAEFIRSLIAEPLDGSFDKFVRRWDEALAEELRAGRWMTNNG
ncbi:hypothetical protein [Piscinibacter gummiphilus]|uniref:DUF4123 domain-containing protein n=1 Tax=Piscinibacter gummiphilus TaxID=946333 RepID=A0ABZ0CQ68_9BURK|nr:hypothetical protein [Piscinibacter gummiphilus]WOB07029.1 hypothetical protein RXV79_19155 [Piscinibacter gummiphilus]